MNRYKKLNAAFVKTIKRPGRYGDGRGSLGLSLLVMRITTGCLSKTWSQRLRIHGHAVHDITTADVMGVLLADDFWNRKHVAARVVHRRIGAVMKWVVAQGYRADNPAGAPYRCREAMTPPPTAWIPSAEGASEFCRSVMSPPPYPVGDALHRGAGNLG